MFTIETITSPKWITLDREYANCTVKFAELDEPVDFTAYKFDTEDHGREVWSLIHSGQAGEVEDISSAFQTEKAWQSLRWDRDSRLLQSDIYVTMDRWSGYTDQQKREWSDYRQALRDLPQNTTDPFNPVWPVKPT